MLEEKHYYHFAQEHLMYYGYPYLLLFSCYTHVCAHTLILVKSQLSDVPLKTHSLETTIKRI